MNRLIIKYYQWKISVLRETLKFFLLRVFRILLSRYPELIFVFCESNQVYVFKSPNADKLVDFLMHSYFVEQPRIVFSFNIFRLDLSCENFLDVKYIQGFQVMRVSSEQPNYKNL